jgi:peptide/nickel transport system substrate-binding protein
MSAGPNPYLPILCKKYVETVGLDKARFNPIGSGPYRLVEHKHGDYLKFEASDKHWRVVPEFKNLIVKIVPEESTRAAMLKTGEIDIGQISTQTFPDMQKAKEITAEAWPGGYSVLFPFGGMITAKDPGYKEGYHWSDPWTDQRVRRAMNLAIDREGIIKSIYKGAAKPVSIGYRIPGYEELPPIPYDPEKAKKLLAEAGYPNGFDFNITSVHDFMPAVELPQVVEVVVANWKAIGLRPKIKAMDKASQNRMVRARKDPGYLYNWKGSFFPSYAGQLYDKFFPKGRAVYFLSDEFMDRVLKYEKELDPQKRKAAIHKVRDYWYEQDMTIAVVEAFPIWAYRNEVVGAWPRSAFDKALKLEYIRHPKPLNTVRLFTPGK